MQKMVSAYIPCFNNATTLEEVIAGVRKQDLPIAELYLVDDGSTDGSAALAAKLGVRVVLMGSNQGRGAVRARAMTEAKGDFVLCCDATNVLAADFLRKALAWFDTPKVAAVSGRIVSSSRGNAAARWRSRHLFKEESSGEKPELGKKFGTHGALVSRKIVLEVGNYDASLRQAEDKELADRLVKAGYQTAYDPSLTYSSIARNTVLQVLERHWRWHEAVDGRVSLGGYLSQISYAAKVMARADWQAGDPGCALISLFSPHYGLWKTLRAEKRRGPASRLSSVAAH